MSNKSQLQTNNTDLQSILSTVMGLPTQESCKTGQYVWKKLTAQGGDFVDFVVSDQSTAYPDGGEQGGYWYERFDSAVKGICFGEVTLASSVISIPVSHSLGTIPSWAGIVQKNTYNEGMLGNMNGIGFAVSPSSSSYYTSLKVEKSDTDITFKSAGSYNPFPAGTYYWFAIA